MPVLTREEAQTRARLLDVQRYAIDLDLTTGDDTFDSTTVIEFTARAAGDTFVELKPAELRGATLDGQPLDPTALDDNRLPLTGLTEGPHVLRVDAAMRYSRTGEGMHRFTDPTDGETYTYTQLFLDDVQRVLAAFDQPDLKAVFDVTVTAPDHWTVLANGVTTRQDDGRWTAATTPPISTYLVAVAAGPWHSVRTEHAGLPFGIHCRRSLAPHLDADADEILDVTRRCFDRYHEKFTEPYPFDSYDQAFVPEFNAGAMENPGLVTFRDDFVFRSAVTVSERQTRAMVIAHEMAHMWFGDLVTLKWWDDIWLNESFAEYMGYQTVNEATTRYPDTWIGYGIARKSWGYDADQRPSTHAVAPDPEAVPDTASALLNFDGISYAKGASALRQLVAWMGEKEFLAGINNHFARHRFGNATLADFIDNLASATDRDVHAWAEAWLRTTGIDTLTAGVTAEQGHWTLALDRDGSRPHRATVGVYDRDLADARSLVVRERYETDVPGTGAPESRPGLRPVLVVPNDHDLTYAKVRLDEDSLETTLRCLSGVPDPLTRAVLWNTLRDMVRDGDLAPADYLATAHAHLPEETDVAIVDGVLGFAIHQIADRYVPAADRAAPGPRSPTSRATSSAAPRTARTPACASPPSATSSTARTAPAPSRAGSPTAPSPAGPTSTPSCAGGSCGGSPCSAPPTRRPSPPSSTGTRAPPARRAPPAAGPPCPRPPPRRPPGSGCSTTTPSPTTCSTPPPRGSGSRSRPTSSPRTWRGTTRRPRPSPPGAARPSPPPSAARGSPGTPSPMRTSSSATSSSPAPT